MLLEEGPPVGPDLHADHIQEELSGRTQELGGLRALVLGGTGLIGSHIVLSLLDRGCSVRVLSRAPDHPPALRDLPVEVVPGRLEDSDSVRRALAGIDLLFHAAAPYPTRHLGMEREVRRSVEQMETLLGIFRDATPEELLHHRVPRSRLAAIEQAEMAAHVARSQPERSEVIHRCVRDRDLLSDAERGRLNASLHPSLSECLGLRGLKRIVYTSSVTTIGRPRGAEPGRPSARLARENDRYDLAPDPSPYFACKRLLEAAAVRAANEGLPLTIVNPTLVIDARDAHLTTGRLILPVARRRMPFYLPGSIDAIAGTDVGEGHVLAATRGRTGQRYILGHESMSLRDLLVLIAGEAGVPPPRIPVPFAVAEPISMLTEVVAFACRNPWPAFPTHGLRMLRFTQPVDSSLAVEELGMPRTPVRDAVRRALDWYAREKLL